MNTLMIKQKGINTDTVVLSDKMLLIMARKKNNTRLLPLHRHTQVDSVAAELLCVPQLEEYYFLQRKIICGRIIYTVDPMSYKMQ